MQPPDFELKNLPHYIKLVDKQLKSVAPEHIDGARRLLHASGKRLRPSLVIVTAGAVNDEVIRAAVAVELIHLASLVHDDIIDDGTLRWNVPTINAKEGTTSALLAGDYLFAKGCALAASISAEAGIVIAETITELCKGQAIELSDQHNAERSVASLTTAIKGKTSSLFIAACTLGSLVAGYSQKDVKTLSEFAEYYGIAYQYRDDVLNFTESPKPTGKAASPDIRTGNYTLPTILSLQGTHKETLKKQLNTSEVSTEQVYKILETDDSFNKTLIEAERYERKALDCLGKLNNRELADRLETFLQSS